MTEEELTKLLEKALRNGVKFGRELESSKNKEQLIPVAINAVIKMDAQTIIHEYDFTKIKTDEDMLKEFIDEVINDSNIYGSGIYDRGVKLLETVNKR